MCCLWAPRLVVCVFFFFFFKKKPQGLDASRPRALMCTYHLLGPKGSFQAVLIFVQFL